MKKLLKPTKKLLLLGEPDYIDLYLKYFPIVTTPYLTLPSSEELEEKKKDSITEKKEAYSAQIGLETIPEVENDDFTQT